MKKLMLMLTVVLALAITVNAQQQSSLLLKKQIISGKMDIATTKVDNTIKYDGKWVWQWHCNYSTQAQAQTALNTAMTETKKSYIISEDSGEVWYTTGQYCYQFKYWKTAGMELSNNNTNNNSTITPSKSIKYTKKHTEYHCFTTATERETDKDAREAELQNHLIDSIENYQSQECAECFVEECYKIVWYE